MNAAVTWFAKYHYLNLIGKTLGRLLLTSRQDVTDIDREEHGEQNKRNRMLSLWHQQQGSRATYRHLVEVIEELGNVKTAEDVKKLMNKGRSYVCDERRLWEIRCGSGEEWGMHGNLSPHQVVISKETGHHPLSHLHYLYLLHNHHHLHNLLAGLNRPHLQVFLRMQSILSLKVGFREPWKCLGWA